MHKIVISVTSGLILFVSVFVPFSVSGQYVDAIQKQKLCAHTNAKTIADSFDLDGGDPCFTSDLSIEKTVNDPEPNLGAVITYSLSVTNEGSENASNIVISDVLPSELIFAYPITSKGEYDIKTGHWVIDELSVGQSALLTITAIAIECLSTGEAITNTAEIISSDLPDPDISNNTSAATITVHCADLSLGKTVNNPEPVFGEVVTYSVATNNNGPNIATNIVISDTWPSGIVFVTSNIFQGEYNSTTGLWEINELPVGQKALLTITAIVSECLESGEAITNVARILSTDLPDPERTNNAAEAAISVHCSDLSVEKTVNLPNPYPSTSSQLSSVIYTTTVTNNGPDEATNVQLVDLLPRGLSYISVVTTYGSYTITSGLWHISEPLAVGEQAELVTTAKVDACTNGRTIVNDVASLTSDLPDPQLDKNRAEAIITVAATLDAPCQVFLPIIEKELVCSPIDTFDNKVNSHNKWPTEYEPSIMNYDNNGHYQIQTNDPNLFFMAPLKNIRFDEHYYRVKTDVYWHSTHNAGARYGILFALISNDSGPGRQAYRFLVDNNSSTYYLDRHPNLTNNDRIWETIISDTVLSIIEPNQLTNTLQIDYIDDEIHLYINHKLITVTRDSAYTPVLESRIGLGVYPPDENINVDARFDNFVFCHRGLVTEINARLYIRSILQDLPYVTPKR